MTIPGMYQSDKKYHPCIIYSEEDAVLQDMAIEGKQIQKRANLD